MPPSNYTPRAARGLALAAALLAANGAPAQNVSFEYADLERIANLPATRAQAQQILTAKNPADALAVCDALADAAPGTPARVAGDYLRVQCALRLAQWPSTQASDAFLAVQAERPVAVWVAHRHDGHATLVPGMDPAAAARYALKHQATQAAARRKAGPDAPMATLRAALALDPSMGQTVITAATRSGDAAALADVVRQGDPVSRPKALSAAAALPDKQAALGVLREGVGQPDLAERALFHMAALAADDPSKVSTLLPYLDHPGVAFAAGAALGRLDRPDIARALVAQLDTAPTRESAAARVLALHLMDDARALDQLRDWSERDGPWPGLRDKVRATYFGDAR